jgi:hypothetical protein
MEKLKKPADKQSIGQRILIIFAKFIGVLAVLVCLSICSFLSLIAAYESLAASDARSLMPPIYPDSVEVVSGESMYAGNSGFAAIWVYCTDASVDELLAYFEPQMGEFKGGEGDYYVNSDRENQLLDPLSHILGLGDYGVSFTLFVNQDDVRCTTSSAYVYKIAYSSF